MSSVARSVSDEQHHITIVIARRSKATTKQSQKDTNFNILSLNSGLIENYYSCKIASTAFGQSRNDNFDVELLGLTALAIDLKYPSEKTSKSIYGLTMSVKLNLNFYT